MDPKSNDKGICKRKSRERFETDGRRGGTVTIEDETGERMSVLTATGRVKDPILPWDLQDACHPLTP